MICNIVVVVTIYLYGYPWGISVKMADTTHDTHDPETEIELTFVNTTNLS